ncbi:hypothetical protein KVR01_008051 [Diaporthe batatas]|uniref:uncharacterized protein n=1 Tax=Diaporthe batatas TaxID=748121 RepID=UPI001D03EFCA|nr:uncharacterized protein KVR01_008051 [Diaporthe batatas]KAG8162286.1 hypothetical protein KVR01_008051 [Diaporthe batatas]
MSETKVVKTLTMGKGITLKLIFDPTQPEDSLARWTTEGTAEGRPGDDLFEVPAHWHRYHSEEMHVREGRLRITIDGAERVASAGETVRIPAGAVHSMKSIPGERVVVRESADPPGDYKHLFFADLLSQSWPAGFWHTMRTFYDGDAYPALGLYFKVFDVAFVTLFGGIAKLLGGKRQVKLE